MLKKTIKYVDMNGMSREEDFFFNLTRSEIAELDLTTSGGMIAKLERMTQKIDVPEIITTMKEYILRSYGEKTPDGRHFIKVRDGHRLSEDFEQSPAYDVLFMELVTDANAAVDFITRVIPEEFGNKAREHIANSDMQGESGSQGVSVVSESGSRATN